MRYILLLIFLVSSLGSFSQGMKSHWLLGTDPGFPMGKFVYTDTSYTLIPGQRKMSFKGTQATMSDDQGNLLMSSNGVWIANATGDTMLNGSGLNPGPYANSYPNGLLIPYGNIFLPFPGDTNKVVLFHQTGFDSNIPSKAIFYTVIDKNLDFGKGGVQQKNMVIFQDTLSWGMSATRHANGRDWWIVIVKDNSDKIYKLLLTPDGIVSVNYQQLSVTPAPGAATQLTFSQDGTKFLSTLTNGGVIVEHELRIFDFDRCSGMFSNPRVVDLANGEIGWGLAFAGSGKYAYACSSSNIFQVDLDNLTVDTVATYDGFCFPNNPWCTTFFNMYLAANGKIYITSGSSVQHIHEMNYPDSAGLACDVQQHAINLNGIWNFRSVPNHPNYYLGAVAGSVCDSLGVGIQELQAHDFRFSVSPNPSNGNFRMLYLLPQNQSGVLEVFDVNGRRVYLMALPPWSTLQEVELPSELAGGVYSCVVSSGGQRAVKKVVVVR